MNPNKIKWYLGTSSLSILMEQERRHWLLKTDKTKQVQDVITGDRFRGQIDNLGSDIIIETEKEYTKDYVTKNGTFSQENVSDVLEIANSTFPYTPALNGLHFARLKSINLDIEGTYHNFQLVLKDTDVIFVPMSVAGEDTVQTYRWVRTFTNPVLRVDDGHGNVIEQTVYFKTGVSNPVFYYPIEPSIMPFDTVNTIPATGDVSLITTIEITDEESIGLPLFWFICDESNLGPICNIANNNSLLVAPLSRLLEIGHPGNVSNYKAKLYPMTGVNTGSAPDGQYDQWKIQCAPAMIGRRVAEFANDDTDFDHPVTDIRFVKEGTAAERILSFTGSVGNNVLTMTRNENWVYVDEHTYEIPLTAFVTNLYDATDHPILDSVFDVALDQTIPFENTTTDVGYAGIRMGSSKNVSEQLPRYPHDIEKMKGLPEWLSAENATPQHMSMYAIHNTPYYDPNDQDTRQIAGLIFDPGVERSYDSKFYPGQYRILKVDIINKGSGYNTYNTMYTLERVWLRFNNGEKSNTFFEITEVDENGGVLAISPLYRDLGNNISQIFRGFYNPETNAFYYNPHFTGNPIPTYPDSFYTNFYFDMATEQMYRYHYNSETHSDEYIIESERGTGSSFEMTYDETTLTGNYMQTMWNTTKYSEEELVAVRDAEIAGTGDGKMPDGGNWERYTTAGGQGLVLSLRLQYIEEVAAPITSESIPTEQIGRVYVLSNDSPRYINNRNVQNPKPDRTLARICDIPTSVMQLSNIHGLAPTSVVDKKYIRSEASYTEADQEYVYNGSKDRWVRPIHVDSGDVPIVFRPEQNGNHFVFESMELLKAVDLTNRNDFRVIQRLNQSTTPDHVKIDSIAEPGTGYSVDSMGIIVVGGYSFTYVVESVNDSGGVLTASIGSNDDPNAKINLANFDFATNGSGRTTEYGTSPIGDTTGTGLKVRLIVDNYKSLQPFKGPVFEDLYAFVRDNKGIWMCTYNTSTKQWNKVELVAQANYSETLRTQGEVSVKDSYIHSIIPSIHVLPVNPFDDKKADVDLKVYQTASSINVIDDTRTPVWIPSASDTSELIDDRTVVDINKLYCRQVGTLIASSKNPTAVIQAIKDKNDTRYDSYIFWKWTDPQNTANCEFTYGIIHRSLDNLQSTDISTFLPNNDLLYQNFVHTNPQTTIMWNVPHVGPMVWMFNPYSTIHEKYYVDAHSRELYVTRNPFRWEDIEVLYSNGDTTRTIRLVDDNGKMLYNIYTNNPSIVNADQTYVIYQQPDYQQILVPEDAENKQLPMGAWELVFPSNTQSFKLKNMDSSVEYTPVRMNIIRGADLPNDTDVMNSEGIPVNYKTLLVDENTQTGRLSLRIYNQETGQWLNV